MPRRRLQYGRVKSRRHSTSGGECSTTDKHYPEHAFKTKPRGGQWKQNDWGWKEDEYEGNYYNERKYYEEDSRGTETSRYGRGSCNRREQLIEAEKARLKGIKMKNEMNENSTAESRGDTTHQGRKMARWSEEAWIKDATDWSHAE